jgi:hypothetical protein
VTLLPVYVLAAALVIMFYWLWRVRLRKTFFGVVGVSTPQVSGAPK